jgi:hypothetical protein
VGLPASTWQGMARAEPVNLAEALLAGNYWPGWSVVVGSPFAGLVVAAGEELLAVAAAEQEEEAVQVFAQVLDAVAGVAGRDH